MLLVHANRSSKEGLLDADFIRRIHRTIWHPMIDTATFGDADDMFKIELTPSHDRHGSSLS
jgi:transformation/transcription domain-associated protein